MKNTTVAFLVMVLILCSCGKKKEKSGGGGPPAKAVSPGLLIGNYQTKTIPGILGQNQDICVSRRIDVTSFDFTMTTTYYDDLGYDCLASFPGSPLGSIVAVAKLQLLPNSEEDLRPLNLVLGKIFITPMDYGWETSFANAQSGACDFRGVSLYLGAAIGVNGRDCAELGNFPAQDQVFYSAYWQMDRNTLRFTKFPFEALSFVSVPHDLNISRTKEMGDTYLRVR